MEEKNNKTSGGITAVGLLGVAFVVLKLLGVISWSWVWVLAPFWIPVGIGVAIVLVYLMIVLVTIIKVKKHLK